MRPESHSSDYPTLLLVPIKLSPHKFLNVQHEVQNSRFGLNASYFSVKIKIQAFD